jgi:hypothetical protein
MRERADRYQSANQFIHFRLHGTHVPMLWQHSRCRIGKSQLQQYAPVL